MSEAPPSVRSRPGALAASSSPLIARLEKELRDLWAQPNDPGAAPLSRVCTMNLAVVAASKSLIERYSPVVDEVTASIPARAILASIEPDAAGDALEGSVTAVCSQQDGRTACSERITLVASGSACARSASAIEAFLVPEIPTVLVWLGRVHVDDAVFEDLARSAHRIIVDSDYTSISSLLRVTSWARNQPNRPLVSDLAWTRLASWQEMVARFFDDQTLGAMAHRISKVTVKQASEIGARLGPEAALVLGWLVTRLGWEPSRIGGTLRFRRKDGGAVLVEVASVPRPDEVAPYALAALGLEAHAGGSSLQGSVERELGSGIRGQEGTTPDADVVVWKMTATGRPAIEQRVRLGANKAAKWLERTLRRPAHDPLFVEAVAFAEQIVQDGLNVH